MSIESTFERTLGTEQGMQWWITNGKDTEDGIVQMEAIIKGLPWAKQEQRSWQHW